MLLRSVCVECKLPGFQPVRYEEDESLVLSAKVMKTSFPWTPRENWFSCYKAEKLAQAVLPVQYRTLSFNG